MTGDDVFGAGSGWASLPLRDPAPPARPSDDVPVATVDDVLAVVALVRCARVRDVLAAVLHLDRSARGLAPMLLAEMRRADHGEHVSARSAAGEITIGDRYDEIDAYPLAADEWPDGYVLRLDCARTQHQHPVTPAELRDAGQRGLAKIRTAHRTGRLPRPRTVEHDTTVSRWSPRREH